MAFDSGSSNFFFFLGQRRRSLQVAKDFRYIQFQRYNMLLFGYSSKNMDKKRLFGFYEKFTGVFELYMYFRGYIHRIIFVLFCGVYSAVLFLNFCRDYVKVQCELNGT